MRYRYTGPDASRDLPIPGGVIQFPRMKWVDPVAEAGAMNVDPRHLTVVLAGLGEDWQAEGPVKAARTRKQNQAAEAAEDDTPEQASTPAAPDEEQT